MGARITPSLSAELEEAHRHVLDSMTPAAALALMADLARTTDERGEATWETTLLESGGLITFRGVGPRHGTGEAELLVRALAADNAVEIVLSPSATVTGRIVHTDGTSPGRQLVFLVREDSTLLEAEVSAVEWIGHDGVVRSAHSQPGGEFRVTGVPEGRYVALTSALTGHAPARTPAFDVVSGTAVERLTLTVEPSGLGRPGILVRGPDGAPVPSARVKLRGAQLSFEGTVNDDGWYGLGELYGKFEGGSLEVTDDAGLFRASELGVIPEGARTIEITLEPRRTVERTFVLSGAGGRAVDDHHGTLHVGNSRQSVHGNGDRWTVTLPAEDGESMRLSVYARGFLGRSIEDLVVSNLPDPYVVELQPDPGIRGRVTVNGEPRAGVRVRLFAKWADGALNISGNSVSRRGSELDATKTDEAGQFVVFAPEDGDFALIAAGRRLADAFVDLGPVEVRAGRSSVEIAAGPGGRLEGTCTGTNGEPRPGARLVLCHPYLKTRRTRVKGDGTFAFRRVPAGSWYLREVSDFESAMFTRTHEPADGWSYPSNCAIVDGHTTTWDYVTVDPLDTIVSGAWTHRGLEPGPWTITLEQGGSLIGPVVPFVERHKQESTLGEDGRFELPASSLMEADLSVTAAGIEGAFHRTVAQDELPLTLDEVVGLGRLHIEGAANSAAAKVTLCWTDGPWTFHARVDVPAPGASASMLVPAGTVRLDWIGRAGELASSTSVESQAGQDVNVAVPH